MKYRFFSFKKKKKKIELDRFGTEFHKNAIKLRNLPIAVNCAEYNEQSFGKVKTPKKPEAVSRTVRQ
jgi:hypothetical protein